MTAGSRGRDGTRADRDGGGAGRLAGADTGSADGCGDGLVGATRPLDRAVLVGPVDDVAPRLLGVLLVAGGVVGRVVEVEAYDEEDPASHSSRGRTPGNATMFGRAGHLYVYLSHGLHHCANVVVGDEGRGAAVLLRAAAVVDGRATALARRGGRGADDPRLLAGGPGRLGAAFGLTRADDGVDLVAVGGGGPALLTDDRRVGRLRRGPRVGVRLAADRPRRWWVDDHPAVSAYRRHPLAPPPRTV